MLSSNNEIPSSSPKSQDVSRVLRKPTLDTTTKVGPCTGQNKMTQRVSSQNEPKSAPLFDLSTRTTQQTPAPSKLSISPEKSIGPEKTNKTQAITVTSQPKKTTPEALSIQHLFGTITPACCITVFSCLIFNISFPAMINTFLISTLLTGWKGKYSIFTTFSAIFYNTSNKINTYLIADIEKKEKQLEAHKKQLQSHLACHQNQTINETCLQLINEIKNEAVLYKDNHSLSGKIYQLGSLFNTFSTLTQWSTIFGLSLGIGYVGFTSQLLWFNNFHRILSGSVLKDILQYTVGAPIAMNLLKYTILFFDSKSHQLFFEKEKLEKQLRLANLMLSIPKPKTTA
ncbi:MAG: hypothetical protein HAW62_05520 [Endozoicomonadaceae bacterium]|nr:hypothetical protein [Endozoicomonadaceae bacterium]